MCVTIVVVAVAVETFAGAVVLDAMRIAIIMLKTGEGGRSSLQNIIYLPTVAAGAVVAVAVAAAGGGDGAVGPAVADVVGAAPAGTAGVVVGPQSLPSTFQTISIYSFTNSLRF